MGAVVGGIIAAVGALGSAAMQSSAADDAADAQTGSARTASGLTNSQFNQVRGDQLPYRVGGQAGMSNLLALLGMSPQTQTYKTDPNAPLVRIGGSGAPIANEELYFSDPAYRAAWDEVANIHATQYGSGYLPSSDMRSIEGSIRARLPEPPAVNRRDPNAPLAVVGANGIPTYNDALYRSDKDYRAAWDAVAGEHSKAYGSGYTNLSDLASIEGSIRSRLPAQNPLSPSVPEGQTAIIDGASPQGRLGSISGGPMQSPLLRSFTSQDLQNDPIYQASYQAGLDQGTKALGNQFNAGGMGQSGAAAKAMSRFATDYTSQRGNEAFNRFQSGQTNTFNRLASIAGIGQTSANQTGAAGMQNASNLSNLAVGAGNAQAASGIAQANAGSGALGSISNWWNQQQLINSLNRPQQQQQPVQWAQTYDNNPFMASGGAF